MMMFTVDCELDLPRGVSSSIGSRTDEFTTLVPRRGVDEEAAIRIKGKGRTTQVHQLPALKNTYHRERAGSTVCFINKTLLTRPIASKTMEDLWWKLKFLAENVSYRVSWSSAMPNKCYQGIRIVQNLNHLGGMWHYGGQQRRKKEVTILTAGEKLSRVWFHASP